MIKNKENFESAIPAVKILTCIIFVSFILYIGFLLWGGPSHLHFITRPAPNFQSHGFWQIRQSTIDAHKSSFSQLGIDFQANTLGAGYDDICVHGFEGGLGKSGTPYVYKCVYRTNEFYGVKPDDGKLSTPLQQLDLILQQHGWLGSSNDDVYYLLSELAQRQRNNIQDAINTLPSAYYHNNDLRLEVTVVDLQSPQDRRNPSYPAFQRIDESSQAITNLVNGSNLHEDNTYLSATEIIEKAQKKQYSFIIMINLENTYFEN